LTVADHAEFLGVPPERVEPIAIFSLHSFVKTVRSSELKENRAFDGSN
jgi:hypothetical protein